MKTSFDAFTGSSLSDMLNILLHAEREGVTIGELKEYLQEKKDEQKLISIAYREKILESAKKTTEDTKNITTNWKSKSPKCPLCGDPLSLRSLTSCKKANPGKHKSHWFCDSSPESTCIYERYSMETYEQELKNIGWEE